MQAGTAALARVLHRAALLHGHGHGRVRRQALLRAALDEELGPLPASRRRLAEQTLAEVVTDLDEVTREWLRAQDDARNPRDKAGGCA